MNGGVCSRCIKRCKVRRIPKHTIKSGWLWLCSAIGLALLVAYGWDNLIYVCTRSLLWIMETPGRMTSPKHTWESMPEDSAHARLVKAYYARFTPDAQRRFDILLQEAESVSETAMSEKPWVGKYSYDAPPSMCTRVWLVLFPDGNFVYAWEEDWGCQDRNIGRFDVSAEGIRLWPHYKTTVGWELCGDPELAKRYIFRPVGTNVFLVPSQLRTMTDDEVMDAATDCPQRTNQPPFVVFTKVHSHSSHRGRSLEGLER